MLEIRAARIEELEPAARCIGEAFAADGRFKPEEIAADFTLSLTRDTVFRPENTRVAVLDGEVVSVVQIADRRILVQGVGIPLGFINWVGTNPAQQGHGFGSMALQDAAAYMTVAGWDISLIPGEGVEPFYERAGWVNFQHFYKSTVNAAGVGPGSRWNASAVWRLPSGAGQEPAAVDPVLKLRHQNQGGATGTVLQTEGFFEQWLQEWDEPHSMFYVSGPADRPDAFIRLGAGGAILEYGFLPDAADMIPILVHQSALDARERGQDQIASVDLSDWEESLSACGLKLTRKWVSGYLFRLLHLERLLARLAPSMAERLKKLQSGARADEGAPEPATTQSSWPGRVRLLNPTGNASLWVRNGEVSIVEASDDADVTVELTHAEALDLIFGQIEPADVSLNCSRDWPGALPQLAALFPRTKFRYFPKDGI